jgi:hypothetical protein
VRRNKKSFFDDSFAQNELKNWNFLLKKKDLFRSFFLGRKSLEFKDEDEKNQLSDPLGSFTRPLKPPNIPSSIHG